MSSRRKRKGEEPQGQGSITAFLYEQPSEGRAREGPVAKAPRVEASGDVAEALYSFIKARGGVTRSELFTWAKSKGLRQSDALKLIDELSRAGRVVRRLSDSGELVYVAK